MLNCSVLIHVHLEILILIMGPSLRQKENIYATQQQWVYSSSFQNTPVTEIMSIKSKNQRK